MLTARRKTSQSGQAMIEFLPAILLFMIIIVSSLVFFIGLRESYQMQVAARNSVFAKIRNSGPLISSGGALNVSLHYKFPFSGASNTAVTPLNSCFSARPQVGVPQAILPSIMGVGLNLSRAHNMTIFRRPAPPTACD